MALSVQPPSESSTVPFHRVTGQDATELIDGLMTLVRGRKGGNAFPGPMCVSFRRESIKGARDKPYWVCEKTDGFRFLMYVTRHKGLKLVLLVGRNLADDLYVLPMAHVPRDAYAGSVFDGELVKCYDGSWSFFVFDCMVSEGRNVCPHPFDKRIEEFARAWAPYRFEPGKDTVVVHVKKFFETHDFPNFLLHMEAAAQQMPVDGIVFTPNDMPVILGRHHKMFKWKRPSEHTVDFSVRLSDGTLFLQDKGVPTQAACLVAPPDPSVPDGSICECACVDPRKSLWKFVKVRVDKTYPNDVNTFQGTMRSIEENLDLPELAASF
jgi:mRNA-capping enzyme